MLVTGVVGRFIYTAIPKVEMSASQDKRNLDKGIQDVADQWSSMTVSANVMNQFLKAQEKQEEKDQDLNMGLFSFAKFLFRSELRRRQGVTELEERVLGQLKNQKLKQTALELMTRRAQVERRTQVIGVARRLLTLWRAYHIGLSLVLLIALTVHIVFSIYVTGW